MWGAEGQFSEYKRPRPTQISCRRHKERAAQSQSESVLGCHSRASRLRSDVLKENSSEEDMFPFNELTENPRRGRRSPSSPRPAYVQPWMSPPSQLMDQPWREQTFSRLDRNFLLDDLQNYDTQTRTVTEPRILLVGQTGAGKSSFFNSLNSIFRDHVTMQALCGYGDINVSKKFRTYSVSLGAGGRKLPYILCDTMGLERSGFEEGIKVEDIISVIKGHVSDMYEFNPRAAINCHDPHYIRSPSVKDKMHCVVFVVDANKIVNLPKFQLLKKFKEIKSEVNSLGIPLLVLVTKIDKACMEVQKDLTKVYSSRYLHEKVTQLGQMLGVPVSSISLVKNYATETELNFSMDLLILKALQQMLRAIDVYFEETNVRRTTLW
ncbi:interferon-induced protein 44-like [Polypterus senegalus]|uniref:interferon-induced protein 44-like n=1 Tax=Polypterus senegalus TaxID=55291 RepID=UPI00196354E2|nr:interferon-induced protein 44-like [Polypterus senegalus]